MAGRPAASTRYRLAARSLAFASGSWRRGQGVIVIDHPLKVGDVYSKPRRTKANRDLIAAVKSGRGNPDTPIIVIMQPGADRRYMEPLANQPALEARAGTDQEGARVSR